MSRDAVIIDLRRDAPPPPASFVRAHGGGHGDLWIRVDLADPSNPAVEAMPRPVAPRPEPESARPLEIGADEPLPLALQRVCLRQFDEALAGLRDRSTPDDGVHRTRAALRRIRAVLRLVRSSIGEEAYRGENAVLRDTARALRDVRVSAALVETAEAVAHRAIDESMAGELVAALRGDHAALWAGIGSGGQFITDLTTTTAWARARFASWPTHPGVRPEAAHRRPIPDRFASIGDGLRACYRGGRQALRAATGDPVPEAMQAWRRHVRYLRHQMEVVHLAWPEMIGGIVDSLTGLAALLGDDRDLGDLAWYVSTDPTLVTHDASRHALILELERRRFHLRRRAFEVGHNVYLESSAAFVRRIEGYWRGWRRVLYVAGPRP